MPDLLSFCRHHRNDSDCDLYPEHCDRHNNELENIMGDLTKLTTDITALVADYVAVKAERDQLKADAATQNDADQAAINTLDDTVVAALPVVVPADPATTGDPLTDPLPA